MKIGTLVRIENINEADQKFSDLENMGFSVCQIVYKPEVYNYEEADIIKDAAERHGVTVTAQFCGYNDAFYDWDNYYGFKTAGINVPMYGKSRIEYVKNAALFAKRMGVTDVIIHAGFVPNDPFSESYGAMQAAIHTLGSFLKKQGMNLLLETGGEAPIAMLRIIEDVGLGNIFINFDPANILMYGYGNPVDALYVFGKYVKNMHGKDGCLPTNPKVLGKESVVGEGMVDFPKVFDKLKEIGYDSYVIIEREISGEKQIEDIKKAKAYFEKLMGTVCRPKWRENDEKENT